MLARQRQRVILDMLESQPSLRTIELAKKFEVTDETIRRDLELLDAENKLVRTHGGALRIEKRLHDMPMQTRLQENRTSKQEIAKKALKLIKEGDTILMDSSSTVLALAEILPDINITVISNSYDIIMSLMNKPSIEIISTGGKFNSQSRSYSGALAYAALRRFSIDKCFFSCNGVDLERGASEAIDLHAEFKENALPMCVQKILLCDSSKFGIRSSRFFADFSMIDMVVTDSSADKLFIEKLNSNGTLVY